MSLSTYDNLVKGKESVLIFLGALGMGLITFVYLYLQDPYSFTYYGDAVSHLFGSRKYVDSLTPGMGNLGTVWLPLPHWLFLPFSLIDKLYSTGIAGMVVSLPCHAAASVFIYKIIQNKTNISYIALIGGFLYASNPNMIYLGLNAMTEAPFLLFFIGFVYYFQKWDNGITKSQNSIKYIIIASSFIALATLCRYEGWFVSLVFVLYIFIYVIVKRKNILNFKLAIILLTIISLSGMIFWVASNQYYYHNPLEFVSSDLYSASFQAGERTYREFLFLQPLNVLSIYGLTSWMIYGPILLSLAAIGYALHLRDKNQASGHKLYAFLLLPPLFTLISLLMGIGEMSQWWFNARFATFLAPVVIILASFSMSKFFPLIKKRISLVTIMIIAVFAFQLLSPIFGVVTYLDAEAGWVYKQTPFTVQAAEVLRDQYDSGNVMVMTGSAQAHRIMQISEINLANFDEMIEAYTYKPSFEEPWEYDRWLVIGLDPDADSVTVVEHWLEKIDEIENHYNLIYENQYYKIFVLSND